MPRAKKRKRSAKGHIPLGVLEGRLHHLNRVVKSRGGKAFVEILESGRRKRRKRK